MAKKQRILPLSLIMPQSGVTCDTIKRRHDEFGTKKNYQLLEAIRQDWDNLYEMRRQRERNLRFAFEENGQWGDIVPYFNPETGNVENITEAEYIRRQGMQPLENNLIRRIITKYQGTFVQQGIEPVAFARNPEMKEAADQLTLALQSNWQRHDNNMKWLGEVAIGDACCGGLIAAREKWVMTKDGHYDTMTDFINPTRVFFNSSMQDPLMRDMNRVGCMHDMPKDMLLSKFAKTLEQKQIIEEEYRQCRLAYTTQKTQVGTNNKMHNVSFYNPLGGDECRVFEVWTLETKGRYYCWDMMNGLYFKCDEENIKRVPLARYGKTIDEENNERAMMAAEAGIPVEEVPLIDYGQLKTVKGLGLIYDEFWYVQYLTPLGTILYEAESPYACGCPFTVMMFPMINGEPHPIISDTIPMQKNINRMLMLQDLIMKNAGKNTTFIDSSACDDMTPEDIKHQLTSPNGVIQYDSKLGDRPAIQIGNPVSMGVEGIVSMYIKVMEDATGIHGAAQGKDALSGQSASLYQQQMAASDSMMMPFVEFVNDTMRCIAINKSKMITQFYEDNRFINYSGDPAKGPARFDRLIANKLEAEVSISKASATAVATELSNQMAVSLFQSGAFGIKPLLKSVQLPFAPDLLRNIEEEEAKLQQAQAAGQQYTPQLNSEIVNEAKRQIPITLQREALDYMNSNK